MEVFDVVFSVDSKVVASSVARWVIVVDPSNGVHWLVSVSNIVDEKSHGNRVNVSIVVTTWEFSVNHSVVHGISESRLSIEPIDNGVNGSCHILAWLMHMEVRERPSIAEIGLVEEVPLVLEGASHALDLVCERSRFNHRVVRFSLGQFRERFLQNTDDVVDLRNSLRAISFQNFLGDSCYNHVSLEVPSIDRCAD
jgi:hypothetical protein